MIPQDMKEFLEWMFNLNPNEPLDMHEALTIYYHPEIYGEII